MMEVVSLGKTTYPMAWRPAPPRLPSPYARTLSGLGQQIANRPASPLDSSFVTFLTSSLASTSSLMLAYRLMKADNPLHTLFWVFGVAAGIKALHDIGRGF